MLIKSDEKKEKEIIEQLVEEDDELRKRHEIFLAEMAFKQELINARKSNFSSLNSFIEEAVRDKLILLKTGSAT